jgi:thiamine kinase-like enzyme
MQDRKQHQQEVRSFLQKHFSSQSWKFSLPQGTGNETYLARTREQIFFVKLGVQIARYQAMASLGLVPQVLAAGHLPDGTPILVQAYIAGRTPSRKDYHANLEKIAAIINTTHQSDEVNRVLPEVSSCLYRMVGLEALTRLRQRWNYYRAQVPDVAGFVDESLDHLEQQVGDFQGTGLVASHNDICNANWLITPDGQLYLLDLESMALEDPAVDIGATLWWYYPPRLRQRFLEIVGHADDRAFEKRMQVRMAMHCLHITLPRQDSFDRFDPASFAGDLVDFRAILAGEDNPQGYDD